MPTTSATSADGDERSKKRLRPNSLTACDGCQARKSRCEMISPTECQRCQSLGVDCLFLGNPVNEVSTSGVDKAIHQWAPIARLEQRVSRVEGMLTRLTSQTAARLLPEAEKVSIDPVREYYRAYNENGDEPSHLNRASPDQRLGAYLHVSSILALNHWPKFADPEQEHLIEGKDMRRLTEDFPRLITDVFPLTVILYSLVCSDHPLVKSCILHNLGGLTVEQPPSRQTLANTALVLRNLAVIPAAEPSRAIALGLLILSFSPASRTDISLPRTPDPYEASSRAMRIALRLGLNKGARIMAQRGLEVSEEAAVDVVLWYLISHRYAWVDLLSADCFTARPSLCPLLCEILNGDNPALQSRPDLVHLLYESRLIHLVRPLSEAIADGQCGMISNDSLALLISALTDFSSSIARWHEDVSILQFLSSCAWLCLHGQQIKMMAFLKVSNDHRGGITLDAVNNQHLSLMRYCSSELRRVALDIVDLVVVSRMTPARLPSYNLTLCFAAYALVQPVNMDPDKRAAFQRYRQLLITSHTAGQRYVDLLDERRKNSPPTNLPSPSREGAGCPHHMDALDPMLDMSWILDPSWMGLVDIFPIE